MKIIVALGNPTAKYEMTRHNVGFMIADYLAYKQNDKFSTISKFKAQILKTKIAHEPVIIIKPETYMNLSGEAVVATMQYFKADIKDLFIVFDDLSLDLGNLRFRNSGSDGGHNGIKSIISSLGGKSNFPRLKVGIGPQPVLMPSENFVLSTFHKDEEALLKKVIEKSAEAIEFYLKNGMTEAQNKFNGRIE